MGFSLVQFSVDTVAAAQVSSASGRVELLANDPGRVTLRAAVSAGPAAPAQASFFCNLDPAVGDIDVGELSGLALQALAVGETRTVDVRVNTGSQALGAYDLELFMDATLVTVTNVAPLYTGGLLDFRFKDGVLKVSGTTEGLQGSAARLVRVSLRALDSGMLSITGQIVTLSQTDVLGSALAGLETPRPIVAGHVTQLIGQVNRRAVEKERGHPARVARGRRATTCESGDTNGDCVFTVNDVRFVLLYLVHESLGFVLPAGQVVVNTLNAAPHARDNLDSDHNGVVNERDASFLNKINVGLLYFIEQVQAVSVDASASCQVEVSALALAPGDGPAPAEDVRVLFVFSLPEASVPVLSGPAGNETAVHALEAAEAHITSGTFVTAEIGDGLLGIVVEATVANASTGEVRAAVPVAINNTEIGVTVIQVTAASSKFMSGDEDDFVYAHALLASFASVSGNVTVTSNSPNGYSPLRTVVVVNDTITCKFYQGLCEELPCDDNEYLDNVCTMSTNAQCAACSECELDEVQLAECSSTSNTVCLAVEDDDSAFPVAAVAAGVSLGCCLPLILVVLLALRRRRKVPREEDQQEFWWWLEELVEVLPEDEGYMKPAAEVEDDDDLDANYLNVGTDDREYLDVLFTTGNALPEPDTMASKLLRQAERHADMQLMPSDLASLDAGPGSRSAATTPAMQRKPTIANFGNETALRRQSRARFLALPGDTRTEAPSAEALASMTVEDAASNGAVEALRLLLEGGASAEGEGSDLGPLHLAAAKGHVDACALLIKHGADVQRRTRVTKQMPLHHAVRHDHSRVVAFLLDHGAPVNAKAAGGYTALAVAAHFGSAQSMRLLLQRGASVHSLSKREQYTPLHIAMTTRHMLTSLQLIEHADTDHNAVDLKGRTPLHVAAQFGNMAAVVALVRAGARKDVMEENGDTPAALARSMGHEAVAAYLEDDEAVNAHVTLHRRPSWVTRARLHSCWRRARRWTARTTRRQRCSRCTWRRRAGTWRPCGRCWPAEPTSMRALACTSRRRCTLRPR